MVQDPIEAKLAELGLALPPPPAPAGSYVPFRIHGNTLYVSGVLPVRDGNITHAGQVPTQPKRPPKCARSTRSPRSSSPWAA